MCVIQVYKVNNKNSAVLLKQADLGAKSNISISTGKGDLYGSFVFPLYCNVL